MTLNSRRWLIGFLLCGALGAPAVNAADEAKLEIRKFELAYDVFGPLRKESSYFPGERLCCRYDVHGGKLNEAGQAEIEITCRILDSRGRVRTAFSNSIKSVRWTCADAFSRVHTMHLFPDDFLPGQYQLEISVEDRLTKQEAKCSQPITIKPVQLALVSPRCHSDARREVSAPFSGLVEQTLYLSAEVIGEDRTEGKILLTFAVELLDGEGDNVLHEMTPFDMKTEDPAFIENVGRHATMQISVPLKHPGKYKLRLVVTDQFAGHRATLELPLQVLDSDNPSELAAR